MQEEIVLLTIITVLIVAKCNVNSLPQKQLNACQGVLIVAKCNVNIDFKIRRKLTEDGINSSKV